jgi:hypothetical protein
MPLEASTVLTILRFSQGPLATIRSGIIAPVVKRSICNLVGQVGGLEVGSPVRSVEGVQPPGLVPFYFPTHAHVLSAPCTSWDFGAF